MAISRRRFIRAGTLTAIAGIALKPQLLALAQQSTLGTSQGFAIPLKAERQPGYMFTSGTFQPYVGSIFQAPNARGEMVGLKLVSVTPYTPSRATRLATKNSPETESFSLTFTSSSKLPPFTSVHKVSHPALGDFELFLTAHSTSKASVYQAVFNHI